MKKSLKVISLVLGTCILFTGCSGKKAYDEEEPNISYEPLFEDLKQNNPPADNVTASNENAAYFDMGDDWSRIMRENGYTNRDMFDLYNVSFLDDQIQRGNYFYYTIDPRTIVNHQSGSYWEYDYLLNHGYHLEVYTSMGQTGYVMIPN